VLRAGLPGSISALFGRLFEFGHLFDSLAGSPYSVRVIVKAPSRQTGERRIKSRVQAPLNVKVVFSTENLLTKHIFK
jgi:hypothetical protein